MLIFLMCLQFFPLKAEGANHVKIEKEHLETFFDDFFKEKMEEYHIPGAALTFVKDGEIIFSKGYGYSKIEKKIPVDPNHTIFRVASLAKLFTAAGVLKLVDEGKVQFNQDINSYLHTFQIPETFRDPITLSHLLTHTEGFEQSTIGSKAMDASKLMPLAEYVKQDLPKRFTKPGEFITYGNHASAVQGALIEEVTGKSFPQYMDEMLFHPLNMEKSTFIQPLTETLAQNRVVEYRYNEGEYQVLQGSYSQMASAGGMHATAEDIAQFLKMISSRGMVNGKQWISPSVLEKMLEPQFRSHQGLPGITYGFFERFENQERAVFRDGDSEGSNGRVFFLPEHNLGFVFLMNNNEVRVRDELVSRFLDKFFSENKPAFAGVNSNHIANERFDGIYTYIQYPRSDFTKAMSLFIAVKVSSNSDETLTIEPLGEDPYGGLNEKLTFQMIEPMLFRGVEKEMYIAFEKDESGKIEHMYSGSGYHGTFKKLAWYENVNLHKQIFLGFIILFSITSLIWLIGIAYKKVKKKPTLNQPLRKVFHFSGVVSALNGLFLILLMPAIALVGMTPGLPAFTKGITPFMLVVFSLPLINTIFIFVLTYFLIKMWKNSASAILYKAYFSFIVAAAWLFQPYLYYWKLLGYWF